MLSAALGPRDWPEERTLWGRADSVFLTFDDDGMIVSDHSYSIDPVGAAEQDPRG